MPTQVSFFNVKEVRVDKVTTKRGTTWYTVEIYDDKSRHEVTIHESPDGPLVWEDNIPRQLALDLDPSHADA